MKRGLNWFISKFFPPAGSLDSSIFGVFFLKLKSLIDSKIIVFIWKKSFVPVFGFRRENEERRIFRKKKKRRKILGEFFWNFFWQEFFFLFTLSVKKYLRQFYWTKINWFLIFWEELFFWRISPKKFFQRNSKNFLQIEKNEKFS